MDGANTIYTPGWVWVEGERVYDASNPEHGKYAVGGWQVYRTSSEHVHVGCR